MSINMSMNDMMSCIDLNKFLNITETLTYSLDTWDETIDITHVGDKELDEPVYLDIYTVYLQQNYVVNFKKPLWENIEVLHSTDTSVHKFIFTKHDAVAESVLYAYPTFNERTVMCVSTQTGCPMGCTFCGTGKFFGRDLTADEIIFQIEEMKRQYNINFDEVKNLQLMFMSMGEPILNENMSEVYSYLSREYPDAKLLVSTSAPKTKTGWDSFMNDVQFYSGLGLQFSVHESTDEARDKLIPMKAKLTLEEIAIKGTEFFVASGGRKPFFNYCVHPGNDTDEDIARLRNLFDPRVWECTLSVICEKDQTVADATRSQLALIQDFDSRMIQVGYNTRIFDPAGQDDCGGGCGQLWQVQKFASENPHIMKQSAGNKIHCRSLTE